MPTLKKSSIGKKSAARKPAVSKHTTAKRRKTVVKRRVSLSGSQRGSIKRFKLSKYLKRTGTNKKLVLLVGLAFFAGLGSYLVFSTQASTVTLVSVEAESMALPSGASVISDSMASGGKAILMKTNGAASGSASTSQDVTAITVRVRGSSCQGAPQLVLNANGNNIATHNVSGTWSDYTTSVSLPSGTQNLTVSFTNAFSESKGKSGNFKCQRSLEVDKVSLLGAVSSSEPLSLTLTFPMEGSTVAAGPTKLTASASGPVKWVEFWANGSKLGIDTTAPYEHTWDTSGKSGSQSVAAVANDGQGVDGVFDSHRVSHTVNFTVNSTTSVPPPSGITTPPGEPALGTVIAAADFEDGTVGTLNSYTQCYPGDLTFPTGGAAQGTRYANFKVREGFNEPDTGDERCEAFKAQIPSLDTYYTRQWIKIPAASQFTEWLTTTQWKTTVEPAGSPPMDLFLLPANAMYGGYEHFSLNSGNSSINAWKSPSLQRDKWYRVITKAYYHSDPTKGWVEVWFGDENGVSQQTMKNGQTRFYMKTAEPNSTHHFRFGIRRDSGGNSGTTQVQYDTIQIDKSTATSP